MENDTLVIVQGAGEMASGVIFHLHNSGYKVIALEQSQPVCVRRQVCFADAVYTQEVEVEGVKAKFVATIDDALLLVESNIVPVLIDPDGKHIRSISPIAIVDGRMLKKQIEVSLAESPMRIGLGPGFIVGRNCHLVIETNRGENLGKVITKGKAQDHTGIPGEVNSYTYERVLRASANGVFKSYVTIGDRIKQHDLIGEINDVEVLSQIDGIVRGLIHDGSEVFIGQKIGDIDPRGDKKLCYKISDKAHAIGKGVLKALQS